jgi:hypothetical protein
MALVRIASASQPCLLMRIPRAGLPFFSRFCARFFPFFVCFARFTTLVARFSTNARLAIHGIRGRLARQVASLKSQFCTQGRQIMLREPIERSPHTVIVAHISCDPLSQSMLHRLLGKKWRHHRALTVAEAQSIHHHSLHEFFLSGVTHIQRDG